MKKLIIADDHSVVRAGIKQILSEIPGLEVVAEATNTEETLAEVRSHRPDLLILDLSMPGRGGFAVLGELKKEKSSPAVLVLSMHPEELYAKRVFKAGASGYLNKESTTEKLKEAITKILAGGRYVSESFAEQLLSEFGNDDSKPAHEKLTDREFQVMHFLVGGKTVTEISRELALSVKTISTYRSRILKKLNLKNNVELTRYAIAQGLIDRSI